MKRHLTEDEVKDILSEIEPLPCIQTDISHQICSRIRSEVEQQLEGIEIYPDMIPELKQKITKHYYKNQIQPGECVGISHCTKSWRTTDTNVP